MQAYICIPFFRDLNLLVWVTNKQPDQDTQLTHTFKKQDSKIFQDHLKASAVCFSMFIPESDEKYPLTVGIEWDFEDGNMLTKLEALLCLSTATQSC